VTPYVARGHAPASDDHVGREPAWHTSTVLCHVDTRTFTPAQAGLTHRPVADSARPISRHKGLC
jgi:hypothetical protein